MTALLTVAEVAARLRVRDARTARKLMIATGRAVQVARRTLLDEDDVALILDQQRIPVPPAATRATGRQREARDWQRTPLPAGWWRDTTTPEAGEE
jgi:hypothetical protein